MSTSDAVTAALGSLPRWVPWAQSAALVGAFAVALVVGAIGIWIAARPLLRARDAHWTERARHAQGLLWPRLLPCLWLWCCACIVLAGTGRGTSAVPERALELAWVLAPFAALFLLARVARRAALGDRWPIGAWLRESALWISVLYAPLPLALVVWTTAHRADAPGRAAILATASALYVAALAGAGSWFARRVGLSQRAPDSLRVLAERCAARTGARLRAIDVFPMRMANALAFPLLGRIAVTTRALEVLDEPKLEGVLLHELGHVTEPRSWFARRMLPGLAFLAVLLAPLWSELTYAQQMLAGLAIVALVLAERGFRRRTEERADELAGAHAASSEAYARALERIYAANLIPAVQRRARMHPDLYDRMLSAGVTPDFARPQSPPLERARVQVFVTLALFIAAIAAFSVSVEDAGERELSERELHWRIALGSVPAYSLGELGRARFDAERFDEAAVLMRAAAELAPGEPMLAAGLAIAQARRLDVPAARAALDEAERRLQAALSTTESAEENTRAVQTARDAVRWAERQPAEH